MIDGLIKILFIIPAAFVFALAVGLIYCALGKLAEWWTTETVEQRNNRKAVEQWLSR